MMPKLIDWREWRADEELPVNERGYEDVVEMPPAPGSVDLLVLFPGPLLGLRRGNARFGSCA